MSIGACVCVCETRRISSSPPRPLLAYDILLLFFFFFFFEINLVSFLFSNHERRMLHSAAELTYVHHSFHSSVSRHFQISSLFFLPPSKHRIFAYYSIPGKKCYQELKKKKRRALPYVMKSRQHFVSEIQSIICTSILYYYLLGFALRLL